MWRQLKRTCRTRIGLSSIEKGWLEACAARRADEFPKHRTLEEAGLAGEAAGDEPGDQGDGEGCGYPASLFYGAGDGEMGLGEGDVPGSGDGLLDELIGSEAKDPSGEEDAGDGALPREGDGGGLKGFILNGFHD